MFSYTYQPHTMILSSTAPSQSPKPQPEQQPVHKSDNRILETIGEDMVMLDYLIGVALQGQEYTFVQYRPTEKHKMCAGLKIDPVQQINMFIKTLREGGALVSRVWSKTSLRELLAVQLVFVLIRRL